MWSIGFARDCCLGESALLPVELPTAAGTWDPCGLAGDEVRLRFSGGWARSADKGCTERTCLEPASWEARGAVGCGGSEWLMTLVGELGAQVLLMKSSMLPPSCNNNHNNNVQVVPADARYY